MQATTDSDDAAVAAPPAGRRQFQLNAAGRSLLDSLMEQGTTQAQIAKAVGLTEGGLSLVRRGNRGASYLTAVRLCNYLNRPLTDLWEGPAAEAVSLV